jgi:hypothetical protein
VKAENELAGLYVNGIAGRVKCAICARQVVGQAFSEGISPTFDAHSGRAIS